MLDDNGDDGSSHMEGGTPMASKWKGFVGVLIIASVLAGVAAILPKETSAQTTPGPSFEPIALGVADLSIEVKFRKGLTTLDLEKVTIPVGGVVPWHCHPGPVTFIVVQGELTALRAHESSRLLGPGEADVEAPGDVRSSENLGTEDVIVYIQFGPPEGQPATIWLTGPDDKCPN
jgi:quercetin dioxygenase-like cupin family protein